MNQRAKQIYGVGTPARFPLSVMIYGLVGLLMLGISIYSWTAGGRFDFVLTVMASICIFVAAVAYRRHKSTGLTC